MIPHLPVFDSAPGLLADGYRYLSRSSARVGSDAFRTRIAGRPALCIRGGDAARFFYEGGRFDRKRSMPPTTVTLLQDYGSVQTLEGAAHARRKAGFVDLLQGSAAQRMAGIARQDLSDSIRAWRTTGGVHTMHKDLPGLFAGVATRWAGVPDDAVPADLADDLWAMIEGAGSFGPMHWNAQLRRSRAEQWARELITAVRKGRVKAVHGTALAAVADWRDEDGRELSPRIAGVELLNLLRPTVAVALFAEFAVLALADHREHRRRFAEGDLTELDGFVHEVRRRTPFFPLIAGRATRDLTWRDETVKKGTWTILDLYGTNHDERLWPRPNSFDPGRYARREGDPRFIVAQGSGEYLADHRCPGDTVTEALLTEVVRAFSGVPWTLASGQDLRVTWGRMPARVRDGVQIVFG